VRHPPHVSLELIEVGEAGFAQIREVRTALAVEVAVIGDVNLEVEEHRLLVENPPTEPDQPLGIA
jgi:hypothetical protein